MQAQVLSQNAMVVKVVWALISFGVLVITLVLYKPGAASDVNIFLIYCMLALSFPAGILVAGCFTLMVLLQQRFDVYFLDLIISNYIGLFVVWFSFFIFGYVQWFVLAPWLWSLRQPERPVNSDEIKQRSVGN